MKFIVFLYQDLQKGIDLGVVSPEILQNFFDLEKYPVMAELIHRFQVSSSCTLYLALFPLLEMPIKDVA
jgi:hypothetical protein